MVLGTCTAALRMQKEQTRRHAAGAHRLEDGSSPCHTIAVVIKDTLQLRADLLAKTLQV